MAFFNLLSSFLFSSLLVILKIYETFPGKHSEKKFILKKHHISKIYMYIYTL